jgi:hypothetical protein
VSLYNLHNELFPDEFNPWEEFFQAKQTEAIVYLTSQHVSPLIAALQLAARLTPIFVEYLTDKSVAELGKTALAYNLWIQNLDLSESRFDAIIVEAVGRISSSLTRSFGDWLDQFCSYHPPSSAPFPINAEALDFLASFSKLFDDQEAKLVISPFLVKIIPILTRYLPSYTRTEDYHHLFITLVRQVVYGWLKYEPDIEVTDRIWMTDRQPRDRRIYYSIGWGSQQLKVGYFNPITGYPHILTYSSFQQFYTQRNAFIQERNRLLACLAEIEEWENHTYLYHPLIREMALLQHDKYRNLISRFFVVFTEKNEFLVFYNKEKKLTFGDIEGKIKNRSPKDRSFTIIRSLLQFDEVVAQFEEQKAFEQLDEQFCLSEKVVKTISPASVLNLPKMPDNLVRTSLSFLVEILKTINFRDPKQKGYICPIFEGKDLRIA